MTGTSIIFSMTMLVFVQGCPFWPADQTGHGAPPTGPPTANFLCQPEPLVLQHGEQGTIELVIFTSGGGKFLGGTFAIGSYEVTGIAGPPVDPEGKELSVTPSFGEESPYDASNPPVIRVQSLNKHPEDRIDDYEVLLKLTATGDPPEVAQFSCLVQVIHTAPTPTPTPPPEPTPTLPQEPTPTPTPIPKFILSGISVRHEIRQGQVHFWVHVQDQAYDGKIYGKEIYFDGVLVERLTYDFSILPHCQPSEVDIPYQGNPPTVIEFHFLRRDGSNLGSVFSQPASTGMGKSVPGAGLPPLRHGCERT